MPLDFGKLDDEQEMIVQTVRRFADRDLRTWAADADRAATPPDRLVAVASELGFFLDAVPAAADGLLDGDYSHMTRALRGYELGRGCAALAALLETNVEPALAVGRWGSDAAKQALFASLASGGLASTFFDSRGALEIVDGRISGKLPPVPALAIAKHILVATPAGVFMIATDKLARTPVAPSGWRAAHWATAVLDRVEVPDAFVITRDLAAIATIHAWANLSLAARAAGVAAVAMEHAEAYAKDRVQFGQAIGSFESLIRLRDDAQTAAMSARLFVLHAAAALDRGLPTANDLASRARVLAGDVVARATIDAVQIYGGYGFVNDFPVEKLMRDARAFEALHGDERLGRVLSMKGAQE